MDVRHDWLDNKEGCGQEVTSCFFTPSSCPRVAFPPLCRLPFILRSLRVLSSRLMCCACACWIAASKCTPAAPPGFQSCAATAAAPPRRSPSSPPRRRSSGLPETRRKCLFVFFFPPFCFSSIKRSKAAKKKPKTHGVKTFSFNPMNVKFIHVLVVSEFVCAFSLLLMI